MKQQILNLEVLAELERAAPRVTVPSYEAHRAVLKALRMYASTNTPQVDISGLLYWCAALHDILPLTDLQGLLAPKIVGNICRNFKMSMKRENDGFKVAWSQKQLDILAQAFPLEPKAVNS
jgi:hypothetical protein